MDELRRQAVFLANRWSRFPLGQRLAMSAALVACVVGFSFVIGRSTTSDWQPVCGGRDFTSKEMTATQSVWRQNGLKSFRKDGQQLCVPKSELSRYESLVPKSKNEEAAASSEWEKQLARANIFTTSEVVEQHRDNALRNELRRLIKAIPAIADADVIWARSKGKSAFSSRPKVTATVNVTPREGHDVTPELAQSLRTAVANMVSDLNAQDVVVLDQSTGLAITDHMDSAILRQQRQRQLERLSQQVESKITSALSVIPGVSVKVTLIDPTERNHFVARPIQHDATTPSTFPKNSVDFEPRPISTGTFWTHDAPNDFITFASLETTTDSSLPDTKNARHSTSEPNDQQTHWRVTVLVPHDFLETQATLNVAENVEYSAATDSEYARLQQIVTSLLPPNAPTTEVVVQQSPPTDRVLNLPETQSAITAFTAWPHAICLLFGIVVMTSFARTRHQPSRQAQGRHQHSTHNVDSEKSNRVSTVEPASSAHTANLAAATQSLIVPTIQPNNVDGRFVDAELTQESEQSLSDSLTESTQSNQSNQLQQRHPILNNKDGEDAIQQLRQADPQRLSEALRHERPQAIAVMLTRFSSQLASETLAGLPTSLQIEVIRRLKSLGEISSELVDEIAQTVCSRLQDEPTVDSVCDQSPNNRIAHLFESTTLPKAFV